MSSNGMEIIPDLNVFLPDFNVREEICVTNTHQIEAPTQDVFNEFTTPISGDGAIVHADTEKLLFEKQRDQVEVPAQDASIGFTAPISRDVVDVAGTIVPADTENLLFEKHMHQVEVPAQDACIGFTASIRRDVDLANEVADVAGAIVPPADTENLLFEKHRDLWEVAKSFEACRSRPQDPHFLPLKSCRKILREGQALGKMVTFDNIAKKTSNWHLDTEKKAIEDELSLLGELETHGFHVEILKNRLNSILFLKKYEEEVKNMSVQMERRLTGHDQTKHENKERLAKIQERIKELQKEDELSAQIHKDRDADIAADEQAERAGDEELDSLKFQFKKLVGSRLY